MIDINNIIQITQQAGKLILDIYHTNFNVAYKDDKSPLTIADQRANELLVQELKQLNSTIHFITEETAQQPYSIRKNWEYTWIIDPLDGTKEFVNKNGEFTVNVALCHQNEIVLGVVYVPVTGITYYAEKDKGAFKIENGVTKKIQTEQPLNTLKVVASRSHLSSSVKDYVAQFEAQYEQVEFVQAGSSLKLCLVAEGKAHIYPRLGPTMEWDTAAGQIVATEAGASITQYETNQPMQYNKEDLLNPFFIVSAI